MNKIDQFFKQVFCKHSYKKVGFREELDRIHNVRYAVRHYKCEHCNKSIWVDGRYDRIGEIK